jgi:hypothetical protein
VWVATNRAAPWPLAGNCNLLGADGIEYTPLADILAKFIRE